MKFNWWAETGMKLMNKSLGIRNQERAEDKVTVLRILYSSQEVLDGALKKETGT